MCAADESATGLPDWECGRRPRGRTVDAVHRESILKKMDDWFKPLCCNQGVVVGTSLQTKEVDATKDFLVFVARNSVSTTGQL